MAPITRSAVCTTHILTQNVFTPWQLIIKKKEKKITVYISSLLRSKRKSPSLGSYFKPHGNSIFSPTLFMSGLYLPHQHRILNSRPLHSPRCLLSVGLYSPLRSKSGHCQLFCPTGKVYKMRTLPKYSSRVTQKLVLVALSHAQSQVVSSDPRQNGNSTQSTNITNVPL